MIYSPSNIGDLTQATPQGVPQLSYPFANAGDSETFLLIQTYRQLNTHWRPAARNEAIDLSQIFSGDVFLPDNIDDAFLIEESEPQHVGAGILQFDRTFGVVPQRRVERRVMGWLRPGLSSEAAQAGSAEPVSFGREFESTLNTVLQRVTVDDASGFAVNDSIRIQVSVQGGSENRGGAVFSWGSRSQTFVAPIIVISGNNLFFQEFFQVDIAPVSAYTLGTVFKNIRRNPRNIPVNASIEITYQVFDDIDRFMPAPPWTAFDANNFETDTVTDDTTPSYLDYAQLINDRITLQIDAPEVDRWRGDIWEIRTPFVEAQ